MPSTEHLYGIRQGIQLRRDPLILATVSRDFTRFLLGGRSYHFYYNEHPSIEITGYTPATAGVSVV